MEAWQLALLAWEGLKLLGVLIGATQPAVTPDPGPACFFRESQNPGAPVCPDDFVFTPVDPDGHWMVRR